MQHLQLEEENIWRANLTWLDESYIRKSLDMLLMSVEGRMFLVDKDSGEFKLVSHNICCKGMSEKTTSSLLRSFLEPASKLYQLKELKEHLSRQNLKKCATNQVLLQTLGDYLSFVTKSLLEIPETHTLMEYVYQVQDLLKETGLIHTLYYNKSHYSSDLQATYTLQNDSDNLNLIYTLSASLVMAESSTNILKHLFQHMVMNVSRTIHSMLFIDPSLDTLVNTLRITYSRDKQGNFIFSGTPLLLTKTMSPLFLSVQVLSLLRIYEPELYRILISWSSTVRISYSPKDIQEDLARATSNYLIADKKIADVFFKIEIDRQDKELLRMQERLKKLKDMKERIERERTDKIRMREIEIFKRTQLQHFLDQQVQEKRSRSIYEKQIQAEMEKSQAIDRILKEKKAEKEKLLKEINFLGRGIDDEIERAIIKETLEKIDLEKVEEEVPENMLDELEMTPKSMVKTEKQDDSEDEEVKTTRPVESNKNQKETPQTPQGKLPAKGKNPFSMLVESIIPGQNKNSEQDQSQTEGKDAVSPSRDQQISPSKKKESMIIDEEDLNDSKMPLTRTGRKVRGAEKSDLKANDLKEMLLLSVNNLINISKFQSEAQKEQEQAEEQEGEKEEKEDQLERAELGTELSAEYSTLELITPPLDTYLDFWLNKLVKLQASLTNKAIIGVLFQKYNLLQIFAHLRSIFLCQRGDLVTEFIDAVFTLESTIDRFGIMNADSLLQAFEDPKCPEVKFRLQLRPNVDLNHVSCISHGVTSLNPRSTTS